jgi:TPR repeat protein
MWERADDGIGMPVDHDEATKWLTLAADYFHPLKVTLARRYFDGVYVEKDEGRGNQLLGQAAGEGVIDAFCEIGVSHLDGRGTPKDEAKAVEYFNQAISLAADNHQYRRTASAYFCLGICHEQGLGGLQKDDSQAFLCYERSADLGNREGMRKMFSYAQLALTEPEKLPDAAVPVLYRRLMALRAG